MQELVIKKSTSILLGLALLCGAAYCVQFALLRNPVVVPPIYFTCVVVVLLMFTINASQDIRLTGLNFIPPKPLVIVVFWTIVVTMCAAYLVSRGGWAADSSHKARIAHLMVGVYLFAFAASAIFGSYFSGLGFRLFLRNPVFWLKYIAMRLRGELERPRSSR